jgi:hypothetical protein
MPPEAAFAGREAHCAEERLRQRAQRRLRQRPNYLGACEEGVRGGTWGSRTLDAERRADDAVLLA